MCASSSQSNHHDLSSDHGKLSYQQSPSLSTPSDGRGSSASFRRKRSHQTSQHSGLSAYSHDPTSGTQTPIVAVAHRYQRSWKSRLAASMRQARDFLSRPRALSRTYSARRHNNALAREELLKGDVKIDINTATKAELMILPGVDGSLASAILDYRKLSVGNRFKRIDDLINVPGLDVAKLNRFREFIVIPKVVKTSTSGDSTDSRPTKATPGNVSNASPTISEHGIRHNPAIVTTVSPSLAQTSFDSGPNNTPLAPTALLNINKATEYDLVTIAGIPEDVAKKIVMARQNSGPFYAVADIKRVKGVSKGLYGRVHDRLTVEDLHHKNKHIMAVLPTSISAGNFRQHSEADSGVATTLSIMAGGSSGSSGGPPSNGAMTSGSAASATNSKQVSPDSNARDMDINNLPDVIIKYSKPSDLELIHKLQVNSQTGARPLIGRGLRGHSRNVSDFGVIADYSEILSPIYPSDMHGIRPIVEPFDFRAPTGESVVRFAFWDLEDCGMEKISNPGVLETICMTILENGISIIAFADLKDTGVVDRIADQLTWPSLHCVREWRGQRGSWRSAVVKTGYYFASGESGSRSRASSGSSLNGDAGGDSQAVYCGFVYDSSRSIELAGRSHYSSPLQQKTQEDAASIHSKSARPECLNVALPKTALHKLAFQPAAAKFSLSSTPSVEDGLIDEPSQLSIVCLKLSPDDAAFFRRRDIALSTSPLLTAVLDAVSVFGDINSSPAKVSAMPIILAGSFGVDAAERCFDLLRVAGYQLVSQEKTNISRKQPGGTMCGDHVWVSDFGAASSAYRQYTGRAAVVRKALTHPQIPDGWAWGGLVSSHCPVWAEFFATPQPMTSEIAEKENSGRESK